MIITVAFDQIVFVVGSIMLVIAAVRRDGSKYTILASLITTFSSQVTLGLSLSLGRLIPYLLIREGLKPNEAPLRPYVPFVAYAILYSLLASLWWHVPEGVHAVYGRWRVLVQVANLSALCFVARALSDALVQTGGIAFLWRGSKIAMILHGSASVYQLIASALHLPLLGISRAYGLTAIANKADYAAFVSKTGQVIMRPGGLAGEPKTAAVLFGTFLLCAFFVGHRLDRSKSDRMLMLAASALSAVGFLAAFSTSAFAGFLIALGTLTVLLGVGAFGRNAVWAILATLIAVYGWAASSGLGVDHLSDLLLQRSIGRVGLAGADPPVAASLKAITENPIIATFGVGLGGSSFLTMDYLNRSFEYAYAPNVGGILFLVELGIVGTLLFLTPAAFQALAVAATLRTRPIDEARLLLVIGVATIVLCMTGSGTALGFPLAIASLVAADFLLSREPVESLNDN